MKKVLLVIVSITTLVGCDTPKETHYVTTSAISRGDCLLNGWELRVIEEITWCVRKENEK